MNKRTEFTYHSFYACNNCGIRSVDYEKAKYCCPPVPVIESEYSCTRCTSVHQDITEARDHAAECWGEVDEAETAYIEALRFGNPLEGLTELVRVRGY